MRDLSLLTYKWRYQAIMQIYETEGINSTQRMKQIDELLRAYEDCESDPTELEADAELMKKAGLICNFLTRLYNYCKIHYCETCPLKDECPDIGIIYGTTRQEVRRIMQELERFEKI